MISNSVILFFFFFYIFVLEKKNSLNIKSYFFRMERDNEWSVFCFKIHSEIKILTIFVSLA